MSPSDNLDSAWCAYAPGKEAWKRQGNFYTAEEVHQILNADDMIVYQPADIVLSAD